MSKKTKTTIITVLAGAILLCAVTLCLLLFGRHSSEGKEGTPQNKGCDFLTDLSFGGYILSEDGDTLFISDIQYDMSEFGKEFSEINTFYMENYLLNEFCEHHVIMKISNAFVKDGKVWIEPELFVDEDVCIPTPWCILHYPAEWADNVNITHVIHDEGYEVKLSTILNGKSVDLFSILMGREGDTVLGKITDSQGGVTAIYADIYKLGDSSEYGDTESQRIEAMREGISYLAAELGNNPEFTGEQ